MWMLNRKNKYEIMKELIRNASPELINQLVTNSSFTGYQTSDNPEYRRKELFEYLDEMYEYWSKYNIDLTDRQYIEVKEDERLDDDYEKNEGHGKVR